ncbi:NADP-dependent oxidoreductase [Sphingomonas sp. So64.6b]|uniref:NADP-dependent oxidoreductase n=1 Tax=Sphingomonas sp. So64.6b TaxID=2997354 RepID=UPI0016008D14|nr:NADP-dependent oxidoreductase [Sphingomonas sp. So64.6b]QNA85665.1 NADP-dependent oxidoreductase [Sphingomonas sp. So64.6b]
MQARQIHLIRRPKGVPVAEDFKIVSVDLADPQAGEVEVEALLLSVDPYMRPRLNADQALHEAMLGTGIGRIVKSRDPAVPEGTLVRHAAGMRERFLSAGNAVRILRPDPALPLSVYMHALGGTGLTAYGGLLKIGALQEGEQVVVSTAGGAVGSVAVQIAKIRQCHVVGITGSDGKLAWLLEQAGIDAAINYRTQDLSAALAAVTPKGIDVYFENVGGAHLDASLPRMNVNGRIPLCGMISTYNGAGEGVNNLSEMIYRRVRMQGFVSTDFASLSDQFVEDMTAWLKAGQIKYQETVIPGFESTPEALIGLFSGRNSGKMLVSVCN